MPVTTATVTATRLNVRRAGATAAEKVGSLPRGTRVEIVARAGGWYEVKAGATRGFVHGDYLHLDAPAAPAGFLCRDDGLCAAELAPPATERIDPTGLPGNARAAIDAWNRFGGVLEPLCAAVEVPAAAAVAVLCVESGGRGFADGRMIVRFENHVFWDQWGKREPDLFRAHFAFDAAKRWTGHRVREAPEEPWTTLHGRGAGQDAEWRALALARTLDEAAALKSISMGAPQIMGFNHARIGYDSAREMFDRFSADERFHLLGLFDFIRGPGTTSPMLEALRRAQHEQFATGYNGPGQATVYGARIRAVVDAFERIAPR